MTRIAGIIAVLVLAVATPAIAMAGDDDGCWESRSYRSSENRPKTDWGQRRTSRPDQSASLDAQPPLPVRNPNVAPGRTAQVAASIWGFEREIGCRRFVPTAGMTIEIPCNE